MVVIQAFKGLQCMNIISNLSSSKKIMFNRHWIMWKEQHCWDGSNSIVQCKVLACSNIMRFQSILCGIQNHVSGQREREEDLLVVCTLQILRRVKGTIYECCYIMFQGLCPLMTCTSLEKQDRQNLYMSSSFDRKYRGSNRSSITDWVQLQFDTTLV